MPYRKTPLVTGEIYHIFNRSIAKQPIFTLKRDYKRSLEMLDFFRFSKLPVAFSYYQSWSNDRKETFRIENYPRDVEILAFCIMPTHFHLLVRQLADGGITKFASNFQNSYSKYFNIKRRRAGSLFQSMFKAVRIEDSEQLIHVSRYIHLNPVSAFIFNIEQLNVYLYSSYIDYVDYSIMHRFVNVDLVMSLFKNRNSYRRFVEDQVDYQRKLELIKHLCLE